MMDDAPLKTRMSMTPKGGRTGAADAVAIMARLKRSVLEYSSFGTHFLS